MPASSVPPVIKEMHKLSVIIVCMNEAKRIGACLESVSFADEIVVVDSGSTDETLEIARRFTERIFVRDWPGMTDQKNFALDKAGHEWVLNLDADEVVSPELGREIQDLLSGGGIKEDGFYIDRRTFFMGEWIRHSGWSPDYILRLFRRDKGRFTGGDPHSHVEVNGATAKLAGPLMHYTYEDISHQARAMTRWGLDAGVEKHKQGKKFRLFDLLFRPPFAFFKAYVIKRGFMDGMAGLVISVMNGYYTWLKYLRMWELERSRDSGGEGSAEGKK